VCLVKGTENKVIMQTGWGEILVIEILATQLAQVSDAQECSQIDFFLKKRQTNSQNLGNKYKQSGKVSPDGQETGKKIFLHANMET
jgi:hypothetical protein